MVRLAAVNRLRAHKESIQAEWLTSIIRKADAINPNPAFHEAIRLLETYGGSEAGRALAGCLDLNDPRVDHAYNMSIIRALDQTRRAPKLCREWHYDPERRGTESELAVNQNILDAIYNWWTAR